MDRGDAVMEDTALSMIKSVVEAHREAGAGRLGDVSQLGRFLQASRLVAQALEKVLCKQDVYEKAEEMLEQLLELLLNNSQLNKVGDDLALFCVLVFMWYASVWHPEKPHTSKFHHFL